MPKQDTTTIDKLIIILFFAIIYFTAITIPISSEYKDVYIQTTISKPLVGDISVTSVSAYTQPNTLLTAPSSLLSIISSGTVVVRAQTDSREERVTAGSIFRTTTQEVNLVLKKVPKNENTVTIKLYENKILVETQVVQLT